jgi:hypothetical protein
MGKKLILSLLVWDYLRSPAKNIAGYLTVYDY